MGKQGGRDSEAGKGAYRNLALYSLPKSVHLLDMARSTAQPVCAQSFRLAYTPSKPTQSANDSAMSTRVRSRSGSPKEGPKS